MIFGNIHISSNSKSEHLVDVIEIIEIYSRSQEYYVNKINYTIEHLIGIVRIIKNISWNISWTPRKQHNM
jgi:hypothetical protein